MQTAMKHLLIACTTLVAAAPVVAQQLPTYSEAAKTYREIRDSYQDRREALDHRLAVTDARIEKLGKERQALIDRRATIDRRENVRLLDLQKKRGSEGVDESLKTIRDNAASDRAAIEQELESIDRLEASAKTQREAILAQIEALPEPPDELRPRSSDELLDSAERDVLTYFGRIAKTLVPTRLKPLPQAWLEEQARLTR